jgi:hypothetical protein
MAGLTLREELKEGYYYAFHPKSFYEYIWICLCQGYGTRTWKVQPPMPPQSEPNHGAWYTSTANKILCEIVAKWEQGHDLEAKFPILTLEDMFPAPKDDILDQPKYWKNDEGLLSAFLQRLERLCKAARRRSPREESR